MAFINIITNAMEACEASDGPGRIAVSIERQSDDFARVMISDNGCGMSRDAVRDCVDLFSSSKVIGMGFGLPIARKVIEQDHSGILALESSPGEGTTVTVLLPIERLEAEVS
jgi:signal transduction histidine kinase